jgi:hypothetical protein
VVFAVFAVIPAKAGIQYFRGALDSRLRGSDEQTSFFSNLLNFHSEILDKHVLLTFQIVPGVGVDDFSFGHEIHPVGK